MPRSRRPTEKFALDGRLELLSALVLLARPRRVPLPYADKVRRHFAPFAAHPAVAELRRLLASGVPEPLFAELALLGTDAGTLRTPELAAFARLVSGFAKASGAEAFFRARGKDHGVFVALARAEAAKGQPPEEVAAYLRARFPDCRFLLAPLLPPAFAVNVAGATELRVRGGAFGRRGLAFEYDAFDCCPAHELTHTILAPLVASSRTAFEAWPGGPPKACRDSSSWSGCVEEHLVRAITLRALKLAGDEPRYLALLRRWSSGGYPFLAAACAGLQEFEISGSDFASFYPRLLPLFLLES